MGLEHFVSAVLPCSSQGLEEKEKSGSPAGWRGNVKLYGSVYYLNNVLSKKDKNISHVVKGVVAIGEEEFAVQLKKKS